VTLSANAQQSEYWNGVAGERWARLQERIDLHMADITQAALRFAQAQPGENVLDIGCGCGTTSFLLSRQVRAVTGLDISKPMLKVARARSASQKAEVEFLEGDASEYPFAPDYDLVFSRFGIMFFADPVRAFANIRTALAANGRLVFVCWRSMAENLWASEPLAAARHLIPPQHPEESMAPGPFAFADGDRLRGILEHAGYASITIERFDGVMHMGNVLADAASETLSIGPLARAAAELDDEARIAICKAVEAAFAKYATPQGVFAPAACWCVRAQT
jgi:SAM-dependent methyltransferase